MGLVKTNNKKEFRLEIKTLKLLKNISDLRKIIQGKEEIIRQQKERIKELSSNLDYANHGESYWQSVREGYTIPG